MVFGLYFRRTEAGWENVPATGPLIVAANHASLIDPPLIGSSSSRAIGYLGRESLFRGALIGRFLRGLGSVPVDRDGSSGKGLKTIIDRLAAGDGVVLFPEGTRTHDGVLQKARAGVGLIVLKTRARVVPVRVFGTFEAFGRQARFPRPKPVGVRFGEVMSFDARADEAMEADRARVKELYQVVADEILAAIGRLEPPRP